MVREFLNYLNRQPRIDDSNLSTIMVLQWTSAIVHDILIYENCVSVANILSKIIIFGMFKSSHWDRVFKYLRKVLSICSIVEGHRFYKIQTYKTNTSTQTASPLVAGLLASGCLVSWLGASMASSSHRFSHPVSLLFFFFTSLPCEPTLFMCQTISA